MTEFYFFSFFWVDCAFLYFIMGDFVVGMATHHDTSETSVMVRKKKSQIKEDIRQSLTFIFLDQDKLKLTHDSEVLLIFYSTDGIVTLECSGASSQECFSGKCPSLSTWNCSMCICPVAFKPGVSESSHFQRHSWRHIPDRRLRLKERGF